MSIILYLLLPAILGGFIQGVTGFGSGIVIMMVLPYLFEHIYEASATSATICMFLNMAMCYTYRKHVNFKKIILPVIIFVMASTLSISYASMINTRLLKGIFGAFMVILSIYYIFIAKNAKVEANYKTMIVCCVLSGLCDGLFGIGGPLMVLYYLASTNTKEEYLGTLQALFVCTNLINFGLRIYNGYIQVSMFPYIGLGIICVLIGLMIGNKLVSKLNIETLKKCTYILIGLSGVLNLIQVL